MLQYSGVQEILPGVTWIARKTGWWLGNAYIYIVIYKYTFIYMFGCEKMHTYSLNPNLGLVIPIDYCNN